VADRNIPSNSDAAYGSVVTHLHFDGADGSTTFTDQKGKTYTVNGDAKLSSGSPKFGSASMLCDGVGDYISTTSNLTDFQFGTGDFTVEAWVKVSPLVTDRVLFDYYQTSQINCWELYMDSSGNPQWWSTDGGSGVLVLGASGAPINTGDWVHVAVCRVLTALAIYVNGVLKASVTDTRDYTISLLRFSIGAQVNTRNPTYDWNGNIDEVRITKGVARYVTNFTPPTAPFDDTPVVLQQVLDGVSQIATGTVSTGADRSFAADQTLDGVTSSTTAAVKVSAAAAQTLAVVGQAASASIAGSASAAQTLFSVAQSATGTTGGADRTASAVQTLASVSQAAGATVTAKTSAANTLAGVTQLSVAHAGIKASASQALGGVSQSAVAQARDAFAATQLLQGVSQTATGIVTDTVRAFVAAQVLAAVSQTARLRHEYIFERNERTIDVRAERRVLGIVPEDRAFAAVPEGRAVAVVGEDRRIAFTD